jgi:RNA polymerase sigma-70 factor (ECF subfamily)
MHELVRRYDPLIRSIAASGSQCRADADDLAQEIYISLWISASRFDPRLGPEAAFVVLVARRRLIEHHRRRATRQTLPPGVTDNQNASHTSAEEVRHQLQRLSGPERELLCLAFARGLTHAQIAAATDLPLGTVKSRLRTALAALRRPTGNLRGRRP